MASTRRRGIWAGGAAYEVTGSGYVPEGEIRPAENGGPAASDNTALRECLLVGLLCTDSTVFEENGRWEIQGDPTEAALIVAARKAGYQPQDWQNHRPRLDAIPFESQRQFVRETLSREVDLRASGPDFVPLDQEPQSSIDYRNHMNSEGSPSETVAADYVWQSGTELSRRVANF